MNYDEINMELQAIAEDLRSEQDQDWQIGERQAGIAQHRYRCAISNPISLMRGSNEE
jgi:hypothetical protein